MKKKLIALLAGALLTVAMSGNALAYFEQGHIIRVVYNLATMTEVATDLGAASTVLAGGSFGGGADSFLNFGGLGTANVSDLKVAYFGVTIGTKDLWLSSSAATQSLSGTTSWSASSGTIGSVLSRYSGLGASTNTLAMGDASSYWVKENGTGTKVGKFNTFFQAANGEISLAALATTGYTAQNLFFWDNPNTAGQLAGVKTISLKTMADGSTQVATPIPPAFMLMGSGLLGLVGIRRKFNKA